ncbi:MAG: ABC transporter ATP-binding protein [Acidobacteria bacterium]|nr:ABC transporter ATP-binding protein [Acidobacteriota bacterium]
MRPGGGGGRRGASAGAIPWRRLARTYVWPHRRRLLAGAGFLALTNELSVSIPGQIGRAVDALRAGAPVGRFALAIAVMGLAIIGVRGLSRILIFNPARDMELELRRDVFSRLLQLPPSFYARHKRGDIISRASNDIGWVRVMVGFGGLQVLNVALALGLTGWKMIGLSPRLTGLAVAPIAVGMLVVQWGIRRLISLYRRNQEQLGEISDHVLGSLQGMATIQGFAAEAAFEDRFRARNLDWLRTGIRMAMVRSLALPLLTLSGAVAVAVLLVAGGAMVENGTLSVGQLAAFIALLMVLLPPLRSLGWLVSVIQRGRAAMERLLELLEAPVEDAGPIVTQAPPERPAGPEILIRRLSFTHGEGQRPVLREIDATIPPGSFTGVFGRTGAGKTTLLRLLARLELPPVGSVLVDGQDLARIDLGAWRGRAVLVPQRPFLFSETVAFNIALQEDPDPGRLRRAVEKAALEEELAGFPEGLETVVGERGIMLSGGQRQRVALARGFYHGGGLVLLDDVLSAVDQGTEQRLVAALEELRHGPGRPTVVVASHRLSVLERTDQVLVLDHGRLVDSGPFDRVVSRPGPLRDAWLAGALGGDADSGAGEVAP